MGYKRKTKAYELDFGDDEEMKGLEVTMGSLSIEKFIELTELMTEYGPGTQRELQDAAELTGGIESLFRYFAKSLIRWNLENDDDSPVPAEYAVCTQSGKPVPAGSRRCSVHKEDQDRIDCELDGVITQDFGFVFRVLMAWVGAMSRVSPPLPDASNSGESSEEANLGLASASRSLTS